jgi:hypothetical protein
MDWTFTDGGGVEPTGAANKPEISSSLAGASAETH